jgi:hypothetical protein
VLTGSLGDRLLEGRQQALGLDLALVRDLPDQGGKLHPHR